jgi:hypothetical protein
MNNFSRHFEGQKFEHVRSEHAHDPLRLRVSAVLFMRMPRTTSREAQARYLAGSRYNSPLGSANCDGGRNQSHTVAGSITRTMPRRKYQKLVPVRSRAMSYDQSAVDSKGRDTEDIGMVWLEWQLVSIHSWGGLKTTICAMDEAVRPTLAKSKIDMAAGFSSRPCYSWLNDRDRLESSL